VSVVKRGNSQYWYIQFQLNGQTYIRSSRTTNHKVAEQMEVDLRAKLHAQQFRGKRESITLGEAIKGHIATKEGLPSYGTLRGHRIAAERTLDMQKPLEELTSSDMERFKRDRETGGAAAQTVKHSLNLIRGAWKRARRLGYATSELEFPSVKLPKFRLRYLSEEEERRLLKELDPKRDGNGFRPHALRDAETQRSLQDAYDLAVLLLDTGARYSEIANIEWVRIHMDQREIHLWRPKVQNETILYMTDRALDVLHRRFQAPRGKYVFRNRLGGPRGYAGRSIKKALVRAGLSDCTIHTLRHTLATRLIQNGMSIYEVREILGHTDIKTTMRYAHLEQRQVTSKARDVINRLNKRAAIERVPAGD
jgi:integrase